MNHPCAVTTATFDEEAGSIPRLNVTFPKFVFTTDPSKCLALPELINLQKRRGRREFYALFQKREAEYKVRGPQFMDVQTRSKMRAVQRQLTHLQQRIEILFDKRAGESIDNDDEKNAFFQSSLMDLVMSTGGHEDSIVHSHMVSRYALLLSRTLGITDRSFAIHMQRGGYLHDIGKIGISSHVLRKKGALTPSEIKIIREHPFLGYELIEDFNFLKKSSRIVLFHHEKYDGSGYPYGLKGDEIPLEARIFAVADAFDAITSNRHYSQGESLPMAVRKIEKERGGHFDPDIVDAFLSVPLDSWLDQKKKSWIPLRSEIAH